MVWLIALAVLIVLTYYKIIKPLGYWKERRVPHKKPLPFIGNSAVFLFKTKSLTDYVEDMYKEFSNERYYGIHQFSKPALYIRDLDLIKNITIKDFDHFMDHCVILPENTEPLMDKNLFNLKGQKWRDMRATLSPSFTSNRMKYMFKLLSECAQEFTQYFEKQNKKIIDVEVKDIFTRFTNDAIASLAFGLKCDSLAEKTNEFYMMGKRVTNFNAVRLALISIIHMVPYLNKLIPLSLLPTSASSFFRNVITENITRREKEGISRPDMLNLLIEVRNGPLHHDAPKTINVQESKKYFNRNPKLYLTDEDITAQALIFFFGGFDTSSTLMSFLTYELALNPQIQTKLQKEIDETLLECNGILTYEGLHKMKYMDMVVSETLRKWPPIFQFDRICVKDYVIEPVKPQESPLTIEKGVSVFLPVAGLHHDPKYFKNPYEFDPERFNDENKLNIEPYSYIPFGSGPRNCIASRFALMENKTLIFYLFSKFNVVVTSKTAIPLKLAKGTFNIVSEEGVWVGLEQRKINV